MPDEPPKKSFKQAAEDHSCTREKLRTEMCAREYKVRGRGNEQEIKRKNARNGIVIKWRVGIRVQIKKISDETCST